VIQLPRVDLAQEIKDGKLYLRGDDWARFRFSFSVESYPIGIYAIRSNGPDRIQMLRRWDHQGETFDPISGLTVPFKGRQFFRIKAGLPLFLVEYAQGFHHVLSKVAFKAARVELFDTDVSGAPPDFRFECVEMLDIQILKEKGAPAPPLET